MKKSVVLFQITFLAAMLCRLISYSQGNGFEIYLETEYDERPTIFHLDEDSNFVGLILKAWRTDSTYAEDSFLYKIDQSGDTISWKITKQDTILRYIQLTRINHDPKGFLLLGTGFKKGENPLQPFTIFTRINDNWNIIWEKHYRFNYYYLGYMYHGIELKNGDFLYGCTPQGAVMFLFKLSSLGDSLDFASWTGNQSGELWGLTFNPDSSAYWMHTEGAYYPGSGGQVCSVVEVDTNLCYTDHHMYPEFLMPPFNSKIYPGNRIVTGGSGIVPDIPNQDNDHLISAFILNNELNVLQENLFTDPDTNSRAAEMQGLDYYDPSCLYLGGTHNLQDIVGQYPSWMFIAKLDDTLGVIYEKYLGGDAYYWLASITASSDGGVLLASTRHELGLTFLQRDVVIIKLDSNGLITGISDNYQIPVSDAIVYPNPGTDRLYIRTALNECYIKLFDLNGKLLLKKLIKDRITSIEMSHIPQGIYPYLLVRQNKIIQSGIWIKK